MVPKPTIYFKYKPLEYFINSRYYDVEFSNIDKKDWTTLNEFSFSDIGTEILKVTEDIHIEILYEIIDNTIDLYSGSYKNGKLGQYIPEHNGEWYFNIIHMDMIEEIFTKEQHPEYYL